MAQASRRVSTRTLIADDHRAVRDGVRAILAAASEFEIVGEAADGLEALARARALRPDLVIVDNSMPGLTGVDVVRALAAELPETAVVMLTLDEHVEAAAMAAGAIAHVAKDAAPSVLLRAAGDARRRLAARRSLERLDGEARSVVDALVAAGAEASQLGLAIEAREPGEALAACLRRAHVPDAALTVALARVAGCELRSLAPTTDVESLGQYTAPRTVDPVDRAAARTLPRRFCESRGCILIGCADGECTLALADPLDRDTPREVEEILAGPRLRVVAATRADIRDALERVHELARPLVRAGLAALR